jgi:drug/metabolite transporter (DMT)-like permease
MQLNRGTILLLFGALCISFAPVFVMLLGIDRMSPTSIGFWRTFLGAIFLFGLTLIRGQTVRVNMTIIRWAILAGFLFSVDLYFWHWSIVYSGAGIATILANTQVFATAILGYFIFRQKLSLKFFIAAVSAMAGVALLVGLGSKIELSENYITGVMFGLITGLAYANYLVTLKYAGQKEKLPDFITFMAWVSLFTSVFLAGATIVESDSVIPPDVYSIVILVMLAIVAQTIGWWAISTGLSTVEASRAGLIILLQPVLATIWGILFFAEEFTPVQLFGALITLSAIYIGGVSRSRQK